MCAHYQTRLSVIDFLFDLVKSSTFSPSQSLSLTLSVLCFSACFCSMYVTAVVRAVAMHFLVFFLTTSLVCMPALFTLAQLSPAFYAQSCPSAVSTVTNSIISLAKKDNVVAPSMLRLILHDCFVEGCDGSILLSSTSGNKAERDAPDNVNLPQNAFNAIIAAKKAVEQVCPGVVSCADILALAARDVVVFLGGPTWDVPLGRLDGRVSTAASVEGRLPGANFNIKQLSDNFGSVGLSLQDMVILSGAHTIGFSHCDQFKNRLYSFNSSVTADPSLDAGFAQQLQKKCPAAGGDNLQAFDIQSPFTFDNNYFKDLQSGKGLLFSDQVLFQDASTRSTVESMAASQDAFFKSFAASMIKMTLIAPKQGGQGEVRKECTIVNAGGANVKPSPSGGNVSPTTGSASPPAKPVSQPAAPVAPSPPPPKPVPIAMPPPKAVPVILPPPAPLPPSPKLQPPSPKPTPLLSPPPPSPPPPQVLPPPLQAFPPPTPVSFNPPEVSAPPPSGGITIPGIPGFTAPIHIPFPRFGGSPPPPSSSQSSSKKSAGKKSRRRRV